MGKKRHTGVVVVTQLKIKSDDRTKLCLLVPKAMEQVNSRGLAGWTESKWRCALSASSHL